MASRTSSALATLALAALSTAAVLALGRVFARGGSCYPWSARCCWRTSSASWRAGAAGARRRVALSMSGLAVYMVWALAPAARRSSASRPPTPSGVLATAGRRRRTSCAPPSSRAGVTDGAIVLAVLVVWVMAADRRHARVLAPGDDRRHRPRACACSYGRLRSAPTRWPPGPPPASSSRRCCSCWCSTSHSSDGAGRRSPAGGCGPAPRVIDPRRPRRSHRRRGRTAGRPGAPRRRRRSAHRRARPRARMTAATASSRRWPASARTSSGGARSRSSRCARPPGLLAHRRARPVREHERWAVDAGGPGQRRSAGRAPCARRQHRAAPGVPHIGPRRSLAPGRVRGGADRRRRRPARGEGVEHARHEPSRTSTTSVHGRLGAAAGDAHRRAGRGTDAPVPAEMRGYTSCRPTSLPTSAPRPVRSPPARRRPTTALAPWSSSSSTRPRDSTTRSTSTSGPTRRARTRSASSSRAARLLRAVRGQLHRHGPRRRPPGARRGRLHARPVRQPPASTAVTSDDAHAWPEVWLAGSVGPASSPPPKRPARREPAPGRRGA